MNEPHEDQTEFYSCPLCGRGIGNSVDGVEADDHECKGAYDVSPSHQDNLAAVRAACLLARAPKGAVEATSNHHDPTLPDVLLALEERNRGHYAIDARGELQAWGNYYATGGRWQGLDVHWNLRLPLSGQSEDTVRYIASLLDYHHDTARA